MKILILGASYDQIPLIEYCKKLGYFVAVVSPYGNYSGLRIAGYVYPFDIRDKEKILESIRNEKFNAVCSDQLDLAVPTVAYLAEKLGLNGIGYENSICFRNKGIMRVKAKKYGFFVPEFYEVKNLEIAQKSVKKLKYSFVLKAIDSSGSRGVYKVFNERELTDSFNNAIFYSRGKKCILEQFIEGQEYVVDSYTHNFETSPLIIGKSQNFDIHNKFIPRSRKFRDC